MLLKEHISAAIPAGLMRSQQIIREQKSIENPISLTIAVMPSSDGSGYKRRQTKCLCMPKSYLLVEFPVLLTAILPL